MAELSPVRVDRITASRLPSILGVSPYNSRADLMRLMVREHFGAEKEFQGNFVTDWGHQQELAAIAEYEMLVGVPVDRYGEKQITVIHPEFDWLAATPDGLREDRVVETKAPYKARYTSIKERPDYEVQIRVQMEVCEKELGDLAIYRQNQPLLISPIERDPKWLPSVMPEIEKYLDEYYKTLGDEKLYEVHLEPLKDERTDTTWAEEAMEWLELDFLIKQLQAQKDEAAERLKVLAPSKGARGAGVDLLRFERKGNVNYKKIFTDFGLTPNFEAYRAKSTDIVSVRRIERKKKETE